MGKEKSKVDEEDGNNAKGDDLEIGKREIKKQINFDLPKFDKQLIEMLELDQNDDEESKFHYF